jgi:hypothetical protein
VTGYPLKQQIRSLEAALPSFVSAWLKTQKRVLSSPLSDYKRQYRGLNDKQGRHVVVVDFFHKNTSEVESGDWLTGTWLIDGGGESCLEARYDGQSSRFISFWINAPY